MVSFGLLLGTVGMESISGISRFTLGQLQLGQGVELVPVAMGLYGIGEVLIIAERITHAPELVKVKFRELFPTRSEWKRSFPSMLGGGGVGCFIGLIPGPAAVTPAAWPIIQQTGISRRKVWDGGSQDRFRPATSRPSSAAGVKQPSGTETVGLAGLGAGQSPISSPWTLPSAQSARSTLFTPTSRRLWQGGRW
jgi:putative tricarboxylic transport membrane protein